MLQKKIILASGSPRRKQLLEEMGAEIRIAKPEIQEVYPENLPVDKIPEYLARLKAEAVEQRFEAGQIIIASDTVVILGNEVLGKPADFDQAFEILQKLSGKTHKVITGVYITDQRKHYSLAQATWVTFRKLTDKEIEYYISNYQPYDKAGAYAIQEWLGMVGIEKIEGDYFNVVGLPVQRVYSVLQSF